MENLRLTGYHFFYAWLVKMTGDRRVANVKSSKY